MRLKSALDKKKIRKTGFARAAGPGSGHAKYLKLLKNKLKDGII